MPGGTREATAAETGGYVDQDCWRVAHTMLSKGLREMHCEYNRAQLESLFCLLKLLALWGRTYNLTGLTDPRQMVVKHVLDSVAVMPLLVGRRWLDVGSGAGFPGLVLAVLNPTAAIICLDSNLKKSRFIAHAVRDLALSNVTVARDRLDRFAARARAAETQAGNQFDVVISRAVMPPERLASEARTLLAPGARVLAMLGLKIPIVLPEGYSLRVEPITVPMLNAQRHVAVIEAGLMCQDVVTEPALRGD